MRERKLGTVERLIGALALGGVVTIGASPIWAVATPAIAAIMWTATPDSMTPKIRDALVLTGLALTAAVLGLTPALAIALAWRVCVEVRAGLCHCSAPARGDASAIVTIQEWAAPLAALLVRIEAPPLAQLAGGTVAAVVVADWCIRRLAEWRLGEWRSYDVSKFLSRQAVVVIPLLALPTVPSALVALCAATLLRKTRLPDLHAA